jgi:hypothetical protein
MPIDPQEDPPIKPGRPSEPPRESPPGSPRPEVPPPMRDPGESPTPTELPRRTPDELPVRGPPGPPAPPPAADADMPQGTMRKYGLKRSAECAMNNAASGLSLFKNKSKAAFEGRHNPA